ncbi:MAG: DUF1624 domain-containing protein [Bacilli bacterium]|nr:DUF1624 domain-containing protein [Bacilli bacterium]
MSEAVLEKENISRKPGAFEKRIHEIDFIRGFLIGLVVMDHIFCFLMMFSAGWPHCEGLNRVCSFYWNHDARAIVRFFALTGFTFVSGVSTAFSKNNWIRAGQMLAFSAVLAVGSHVADIFLSKPLHLDTMVIDFNVIAVLAWSTLFYCFFQKGGWKMVAVGVLLTFLLSWFLYPHFMEYVEARNIRAYIPPLVRPDNNADWLPLFPFIFCFFGGALFASAFYPERKSLIKKRYNWERPLCFMGRHSLIIYVCHIVVIIAILSLINVFIGK